MTKHWKVLLPCVAVVSFFGCRAHDPAPFDPRAIQKVETENAVYGEKQSMTPLPTTLQSPFPETQPSSQKQKAPPSTGMAIDSGPIVRMPLREIVQRTVASNMDVRVAGFQPAIDQTRVIEADARFDPTFFANFQYEHRNNWTAGGNNNISSVDNEFQQPFRDQADIITAQTGIQQNLRSGGQAKLQFQAQRQDFDPTRFTPEPFYQNDLTLQITQPLLRDFGYEINQARITIAKNNQKISLLEFRKTLEENIEKVEETYWALVQAERETKILEEQLSGTNRLARVLLGKEGETNRQQISQTNERVETDRALLVRQRARVRDLSDQLKQLMSDPEYPVTSGAVILPADEPVQDPLLFDFREQIETAFGNRLELGEQQMRIDSANIAALVAKNNLLPQLNFQGSIGLEGLDDQFTGAFRSQFSALNLSYTLGLQLEIPIGNRQARAIDQRALLQRQQAIAQYEANLKQIAMEVKQALRDVQTTWQEMVQTGRARYAARDALDALQQREDLGEPLSPEYVDRKLRAQETVADRSRAEAISISAYNIALSKLERAKGTLLRYNNVVLTESPTPFAETIGK
ncbi:MAG TPA: TolC family protein [Tepidisphaeraceae bacterium]|jgi:outer membrane protein TolC|nr:TolC family protein [Tepidisphaeraceae bacterium]